MKDRPWMVATGALAALVLSGAVARAQAASETALVDRMVRLTSDPPAACGPSNALYFEAIAFAEQAEDAKRPVSAIFDTYLADLARVRVLKKCPKGPKPRISPTEKSRLVRTHNRLLADLKACNGDACKRLEEALKTNFFTIAGVVPRDDAAVPQIVRDIAVGVPAGELAEEMVRKLRAGAFEGKEVLDLAKVTLEQASGKGHSQALLPELTAFLGKVNAQEVVPDATLKALFSAVLDLAAKRELSPNKLEALMKQLRAIASDDDLIHLAEALKLRQNVQTSEDWESLRSSVEYLVWLHPDLKAKPGMNVPAKLPDGASREQFLLSLANLLNNAQLAELQRLRAAAAGVSTEPDRIRRLRLLAVRRSAPACDANPAPAPCEASKTLIRSFLVTLGTNPDGVKPAEVPGTADEILTKSEEALRWEPAQRASCDRARYGALCEWPYGGVVVISSELAGGAAVARASWRMSNDTTGLIGGSAATAAISELPRAAQAGVLLGTEALREGTLWKVLLKEHPVAPCSLDQCGALGPPPVAAAPAWRRWTRASLVVAAAASMMGAAYAHNTSPASATDDRLFRVGLVSLAALAGFETWELARPAGGPERNR